MTQHFVFESVPGYSPIHDDREQIKEPVAAGKSQRNERTVWTMQNKFYFTFGTWKQYPYTRGVDFLGYRTFYKYTLLRKSTCLEMEKKMTAIRNKVEAGNMMNYSEWCSINSYKGWLKYADTFRLYQKYVVPLLPYADDYYIRNIKPNTKKGLNAA